MTVKSKARAPKPDPVYAPIDKHIAAHARLYRAYGERGRKHRQEGA